MVAVGFAKLTIRVQDGKAPTVGTNVFEISGVKDKGATASAKISGLAVDPVKTYGSNKPYFISSKGVGDAKIDFDIIDIPRLVRNAVLGLEQDDNGVATATSETEAPYCAVLLEDTDVRGDAIALGFFSGKFSYDGVEWDTTQGKAEELKADTLSYSVSADDKGNYYQDYAGPDATGVAAIKATLGMTASA